MLTLERVDCSLSPKIPASEKTLTTKFRIAGDREAPAQDFPVSDKFSAFADFCHTTLIVRPGIKLLLERSSTS